MTETAEECEIRRSQKNMHTQDELDCDGNHFVAISNGGRFLTMSRGKTFTIYSRIVENNEVYWRPMTARTLP